MVNGTSTNVTGKEKLDLSVDRDSTRAVAGANRLKLGLFAINAKGGSGAVTMIDGPPTIGNWGEQRRIAQAADQAGLEVLIPISRWRGFDGPSQYWNRAFETFTWAAGLAEATEEIQIFSTCHVNFFHPVVAAKMGATVDHISGGRWGINVVAGWNPTEYDMFGMELAEHGERYRFAGEWIEVLEKLWSSAEPFDFQGSFFDLKGAYSSPQPVQSPRPLIMSAGQSPAGMDFAGAQADVIFLNLYRKDIEETREEVERAKAAARAHGREVGIWSIVHVVCRPTEQEALDYVDNYVEAGDFESAAQMAAALMGSDAVTNDSYRRREDKVLRELVARSGNTSFVGSPRQVAEGLGRYSEAGVDGFGLIFVDYESEIDRFGSDVMPLLKEAGLRI